MSYEYEDLFSPEDNVCRVSMERVSKMLHGMVVWSNIFFIIAGVLAFYVKLYIPAGIFISAGIISTIYHSGYDFLGITNEIWDNIDVSMTLVSTVIIGIYGIFILSRSVYEPGISDKVLSVMALFLNALGVTCFILSTMSIKFDRPNENTGFTGPIFASVETDSQICSKKKAEINYLVYHNLWHIFIAMGSIITIAILSKFAKSI